MIKKILNVNGVDRTAIAEADATLADVIHLTHTSLLLLSSKLRAHCLLPKETPMG